VTEGREWRCQFLTGGPRGATGRGKKKGAQWGGCGENGIAPFEIKGNAIHLGTGTEETEPN